MIARKRYLILPDFQFRMIRHWIFLVVLTALASNLITLAFVWRQDQAKGGRLYFVPDQANSYPILVDPPSVKHMDIVFPPLMVALGLACLLSIGAGIFYSHRLAGPIYRIRKTLREAQAGRRVEPIILRKNDEFKELAEDVNSILGRLPAADGADEKI